MLEAHDLSARRGFTQLFSGLSFKVLAGEVLVITGANGTGKTTLLRILAGLSAPAAGTIAWNGQTVRPFDPVLRSALAFAGHHPALKDELTAEENLAALVGLSEGLVSKDAIGAALDAVALSRQRRLPARVLSQGQRRRIGLARLTLVKRLLWLLDEPVTALDAAGTALLARLVGEHVKAGGLAIAATHTPLDLPQARMRSLALA
jgi:heme exporter protein A